MSSPQKKASIDSKRHKRHHKKNKKYNDLSDNDEESPSTVKSQTPLKLTFKIGGQTLGEKSVIKSEIPSPKAPKASLSLTHEYEDDDELNDYDEEIAFDDESAELDEEDNEEADDEPKDEEEVWLNALEEGRLHEVDDELKKIRDPKLMTARQRALLENKSLKKKEDAMRLLASQSQAKKTETSVMSEEIMQRKMLKARRRRQQAEEKKEKDKKQTIDRLLRKKQEAANKAKKKKKSDLPKVTYKNNQNGIFICLPPEVAFEFTSSSVPNDPLPMIVTCAREGCTNRKKYSCSKTKLPLCSLECYKHIQTSVNDDNHMIIT